MAQRERPKARTLTEILVASGIDKGVIAAAAEQAARDRPPLAVAVLRSGLVTSTQLAQLLSRALQLPVHRPAGRVPDVPTPLKRRLHVVPIGWALVDGERHAVIGMIDPTDAAALAELQAAVGAPVLPLLVADGADDDFDAAPTISGAPIIPPEKLAAPPPTQQTAARPGGQPSLAREDLAAPPSSAPSMVDVDSELDGALLDALDDSALDYDRGLLEISLLEGNRLDAGGDGVAFDAVPTTPGLPLPKVVGQQLASVDEQAARLLASRSAASASAAALAAAFSKPSQKPVVPGDHTTETIPALPPSIARHTSDPTDPATSPTVRTRLFRVLEEYSGARTPTAMLGRLRVCVVANDTGLRERARRELAQAHVVETIAECKAKAALDAVVLLGPQRVRDVQAALPELMERACVIAIDATGVRAHARGSLANAELAATIMKLLLAAVSR